MLPNNAVVVNQLTENVPNESVDTQINLSNEVALVLHYV